MGLEGAEGGNDVLLVEIGRACVKQNPGRAPILGDMGDIACSLEASASGGLLAGLLAEGGRVAFQKFLFALCSVHRPVKLLDDGMSAGRIAGGASADDGDLKGDVFASLLAWVCPAGDGECEELSVLDGVCCALNAGAVGASEACASSQYRDMECTVGLKALPGDTENQRALERPDFLICSIRGRPRVSPTLVWQPGKEGWRGEICLSPLSPAVGRSFVNRDRSGR